MVPSNSAPVRMQHTLRESFPASCATSDNDTSCSWDDWDSVRGLLITPGKRLSAFRLPIDALVQRPFFSIVLYTGTRCLMIKRAFRVLRLIACDGC